jgi:DNA polymerase-3 subunit delta'
MAEKIAFKPFSDIVGQEEAIKYLKEVLVRGRLPHAYLFTGIPGVGKSTTAMALTQAMNCMEPERGEACGICPTCRQVAGGNFPDFRLISPEGQKIKIGQIRELNRSTGYKLVSGNYRVNILQWAEHMNSEAANSFLKTLEEPPPGNLFILNVSETLDLPQTIVSRCQRVPFRPIPVSMIGDWLMRERGLDKEEAWVIARISEGSLGKAIQMSEGDFLGWRQKALPGLINLVHLTTTQLIDKALEYTAEEKKKGHDGFRLWEPNLYHLLGLWKIWYRDLMLLKTDIGGDWMINSDFSHKLQKLSKSYKIEIFIDCFCRLEQAQRDLKRTRNLDLLMESTLLGLKRLHTKEAA